ncbi:Sterol regulatory element-binding protein cleavage-activating protein [Hypsibius exemplaris]|uniref:Sterol regulatory element-binding protein cleavage-activating protein n=1 Tax=Hypsibius exemplaris TaxID=2072580 RepID=A0A1W0WU25_HYPEX|nr:Sterol regulatory element-binding protein cleavage-activating protein [Hypsibius exemplaris]
MDVIRNSNLYQSLRLITARNYYIHGLFCASHPYSIICLVTVVVLFCCFPLTKLPLPGYAPLEFVTPINEFVVAVKQGHVSDDVAEEPKHGADGTDVPEWLLANTQPDCYVQQIVVKAKIHPWTDDLIPIDAVRRPLGLVFDVLNEIQNFSLTSESGKVVSLRDHCFVAQTVLRKYRHYGYLSENDCLLISPANVWDLDLAKYQADSDILGTVFAHDKRTTIDSSPAFKDLAFGIPWAETGIKTQLPSAKCRMIGFAVTIILKDYDRRYIEALAGVLRAKFTKDTAPSESPPVNHIVNVRFQTLPEMVQFLPLILTYLVVLLYLCFSVSKLEMVKSKIGLAISAVITIIASLAMSAGLCSHFGLYSTLSGGEIFPYLVVIIGLENVIVITKSVVSTPVQLDVKFRIAQGLSREGYGITKNFCTELIILLIGYLTMVPAIQEFCMFGFVGLLSDMFLQLVFFSAVLSIDIGRMELSDHLSNRSALTEQPLEVPPDSDQVVLRDFPEVRCPVMAWIARSPPLQPAETSPLRQSDRSQPTSPRLRVPRRLRLFWFVGSKRVMQRLMMAITLAWIAVLVYQSGLLKQAMPHGSFWNNSFLLSRKKADADRLEHVQKLPYRHWPTLFGYYNISLAGKYISILPPISLTSVISPEQAVASRHPLDHKKTRWQSQDFVERQREYLQTKIEEQEKWVIVSLAVSVVIVLVGACLYALRLVWPAKQRILAGYLIRREKIPPRPFQSEVQVYNLAEHLLSVQNIATDEDLIATSCLAGQLRVWNWNDRRALFSLKRMRSAAETGGFISSSTGSFVKDYMLIEGRQIRALALKRDHLAAGCEDGAVEVYSSATGAHLALIPSNNVPVRALAFANGSLLVGRENGELNVYSQTDREYSAVYTAKLHHAAIGRIVVLKDRVVTVGFDNSVKVVRLDDWICLQTLWNSAAHVSAFCLDEPSMTAVCGYRDGRLRVWNALTGSCVNDYTCAVTTAVRSVCLSVDHVLASYTTGQIARWSRREAVPPSILSFGKTEISSLCLRDGFFFLGFVGEVRVFDCGSMQPVKVLSLDGNNPDYIACPSRLALLENSDMVCDYGREVRLLRFSETRKSL